MSVDLTNPMFHDADKAREWFEANRWPNGPICPHCGNVDQGKITSLKGKAHRAGLYKCNECLEQFTVTVGSVMERSKIPLNKWALATFLLAASKKGMSTHQLHRTMKIPYKTAWFLSHRIREAMRDGDLAPLGGGGNIVEADETYHGKVEAPRSRPRNPRKGPFTKGGRSGPSNKRPILALVERGGRVRTFHVPTADQTTVSNIVRENIARESRLHTDESKLYFHEGDHFTAHKTVKHTAKEYVRTDHTIVGPGLVEVEKVHTNSAEGYFSIFKRGMLGVYQHCGEKHLHRYLAEFDFRYNNRIALGITDSERAGKVVKQGAGKRLMYQRPGLRSKA